MPESTALTGDLDSALRSYFAVTTSTELPRRVREMSARTLRARRRPLTGLMAGGVGVLATAALVVVVATHGGSPGGSGALSSGSAPAPNAYGGVARGAITYPGVDTTRLAQSGVVLAPPAGHGTAVLTGAQAQVAAAAGVGAGTGTPGPAVLAFAEISRAPQQGTCLCWVVDVPVSSGLAGSPGTALPRTELVLVDAVNGRVVAALTANGIP